MFGNHLPAGHFAKTAFRNIAKNKTSSAIHILGNDKMVGGFQL